MNWNHTQKTTVEVTSSALARGLYGDPISVPVTEDAATEIVSVAATGQYFSINNNGPGSVYARFGGIVSTTEYNVIFPPGFNHNEMRVAVNENVTVITATGETANLLVSVAAEVQV